MNHQGTPENLKTDSNGAVVRGPGRPKGTHNKVNKAAKDAVAEAAASLGGAARLVAWAKEDPLNEKAFWTIIYPKLIPLAVGGEDGAAIRISTIELVAASVESTD